MLITSRVARIITLRFVKPITPSRATAGASPRPTVCEGNASQRVSSPSHLFFNLAFFTFNFAFFILHFVVPSCRSAQEKICPTKNAPCGTKKSKEITPDGSANHSDSSRVISCSCWAPAFYVTSSFYRLVYIGGLTSTLDSLLFCIFILHPDPDFFKMGCSIKSITKSWRNCV